MFIINENEQMMIVSGVTYLLHLVKSFPKHLMSWAQVQHMFESQCAKLTPAKFNILKTRLVLEASEAQLFVFHGGVFLIARMVQVLNDIWRECGSVSIHQFQDAFLIKTGFSLPRLPLRCGFDVCDGIVRKCGSACLKVK